MNYKKIKIMLLISIKTLVSFKYLQSLDISILFPKAETQSTFLAEIFSSYCINNVSMYSVYFLMVFFKHALSVVLVI